MKRLYPLRDVNQHEVVNLFASDNVNANITTAGAGDAGVFVKISNGNLNQDTLSFVADPDWYSSGPNLGWNKRPVNPLRFTTATSGQSVLGMTLMETAEKDENGEFLDRYTEKKAAVQAVTSGETCPVLTRGIVKLNYTAFGAGTLATYVPEVGQLLAISSSAGRLTGYDADSVPAGQIVIGQVLATGSRTNNVNPDYYVGSSTGAYAVIKFDCNNF